MKPHHELLILTVELRCPLPIPLLVVRRPPVVCCARENKLFPTRLLTSEDEYKWYWHQMIYFPETINTVSTRLYTSPMYSLSFSSWAHQLTLCMLASWSCEGVVFLVFLPSSHLTMYHVLSLSLSGLNWRSLFPPLRTGSPFPQNGAPVHRVRAHSLTRVHDTIGYQLFLTDFFYLQKTNKNIWRRAKKQSSEQYQCYLATISRLSPVPWKPNHKISQIVSNIFYAVPRGSLTA
jgi:hypothetical protein